MLSFERIEFEVSGILENVEKSILDWLKGECAN